MSKVAFLIPCFNEEVTIKKVVESVRSSVPNSDIYVYDNNSTDNSRKIVEDIITGDSRVFLKRETRQGKGYVVRSMLRNIEADCYVLIDGDDTYSAEDAPKLIEPVLKGEADMVVGDRLSSTYFEENKRMFHNFGNIFIRNSINFLFNSDIKDVMTGYRAFNKTIAKNIPLLLNGFETETELTIHVVERGFAIKQIPIKYKSRPDGSVSKLNTYKDGFKVIGTVIKLFREYRPLKFWLFFGLISLITAVILFTPVFIDYLNTGLVERMPTLIVAGVFGTCFVLLASLGIILDVVANKHKEICEILVNHYVSKN